MRRRLPVAIVVLALVLAALGGRFAVHMLQLARKGGHNDFATLYTGAHLYREGARFYDPPGRESWQHPEHPAMHEAARRLGTLHAHEDYEHVHAFSYPPFALLPFVPFTALPFRSAAVVWQVLCLGFLVLSFWALWRAVPLSPVSGLLLIALALLYEPLENSLGLGQINQLILVLACGFVWALASGRPVLAGVCLGVATALRVHPGLFIVYLVWRRTWRTAWIAAGTAAACTAVAVLLVGWQATVDYVTVVAPKYARAYPGFGNLSITGWLATVGGTAVPAVDPDGWRLVGRVLSIVTLAGAFWWLRPPGPVAPPRAMAEIGFVTVILYLVVPNTTINHLVFLCIPLAVLLQHVVQSGERRDVAALAVVVLLVGAIDDYYMHPALSGGPQVLLGGIKTYGLAVLAVMTAALVRPRPAEAAP